MEINIIRMAIANNNLLITNHAAIEAENDDLLLDYIYYSVNFGEIIQFYPDDKPFPSCLICGFDAENHPIHIEPLPPIELGGFWLGLRINLWPGRIFVGYLVNLS